MIDYGTDYTCVHGEPKGYCQPCDDFDFMARWASEAPPDAAEDNQAGRHSRAVTAELMRLRVQQDARRLLEQEKNPPAAVPAMLTLTDRLALPVEPQRWRIGDMQPAESRVLLAAQFKAGKTTLVGNLVRSLVDGDDFLDRYPVQPVQGTVVVLDFEMSGRKLDEWLGDQGIRKTDQVVPVVLRGSASSFNILDEQVRTRWAQSLRAAGAEYVVWDCVRPLLDALALDEHRQAGLALTAFDELLKEAGVRDACVVHHMGHSEERSRGDSRLRDWPDVEWRLVRETPEPNSPRFLTAYGRDVDAPEAQLTYDRVTRHLILSGGSRQDAEVTRLLGPVFEWIEANPGATQNAIEAGVDGQQKNLRKAIRALIDKGDVVVRSGPRKARHHFPAGDCVKNSTASAPRHRTTATASPRIGDAVVDAVQNADDPRRSQPAPDGWIEGEL